MTTSRLLSDRYELGEVLGYGGMSEVHRGLDTRLGRDVAIKVLRADLARDPQFQLRFRREAQNAAALNHPAIVAVYDTGEVQSDFGPLPYIVMEYVDGQTLREIVKTQGPMSEQQVIEVMADVCAALDFSHRHSIIHRDDRRVVERGGVLRFAAEPELELGVAGEVRAQHLHRDVAAEPLVDTAVHLGHATVAERVAQLVAVGEQTRGGHRCRFLTV